MLALHLAFAGIGHLVADYSVGIVIAGVLIFIAFFSNVIPVIGPFLGKFRIDCMWAAGLILACIAWGAHIEHDTNLHWVAKQAVIEKAVDKAVSATDTPAAKQQKDPYDDPNN